MTRSQCLLVLIACSGLVACTPCDGDITVHFKFPETLRNVDELEIFVGVHGEIGTQQSMLTASHPLGQAEASVHVQIAKYHAGDELDISVRLSSQGKLVATNSRTTTVTGSCGSLDFDLGFNDTDMNLYIKNRVDLLFVIDDSPGMGAKQTELMAAFPDLLKILDDAGKTPPAWYHIGVVTTDLGAGAITLGSGPCRPGGRSGKLQALGAAADASCQPPVGGENFIDYNQLASTNNLPGGQDLATTLRCMASVGTKGCGVEQPLEAAYQALHTKPAENHDFLRPEALQAVVFLTDEDDCSVPADSDLFDPAMTSYSPTLLYRCTQLGIECIDPSDGRLKPLPDGDSGGLWTGCMSLPATSGGKLIDINKYINLFSAPSGAGGLKVDPNDVILVGLTGSSSVGAASKLVSTSGGSCSAPSATCEAVLQPGCVAPNNPQFTGTPAVRLNQVIEAGRQRQLASICDSSYSSAMQGLGQLIAGKVGLGCLRMPVDPSAPDCTVADVTANADGSTTTTPIPRCAGGDTQTCWQLDPAQCEQLVCANAGDPGQHFSISIHRNSGPQPPSTNIQTSCRTLAVTRDSNGNPPQCGAPL